MRRDKACRAPVARSRMAGVFASGVDDSGTPLSRLACLLRLGRQASGDEHTQGDHRRRNDAAYERNHLILSQLYRSVILRPAEVVPGLIPRPAWRVWTSVRRDRFVL